MDRLENELRNALKRKEPPSGFSGRVLARAEGKGRNAWGVLLKRQGLGWALAAALCIMIFSVGIEYRKTQEEMASGKVAKEQLMLALRIAGDQMQFISSKINRPLTY